MVVSPTQTKFVAEVGLMQIDLTFLTLIKPKDRVKQSIPFSYLSLTAKSLDRAAHAVQMYSDLSARVSWCLTNDDNVIYHMVKLQNTAVFTQTALYLAMKSGDNITYKIAQSPVPCGLFQHNGMLDNQMGMPFSPNGHNLTVVMVRFGSEPRFEPEPDRSEPQFQVQVRLL
ncbi:hypothetical protein EDB84DRAFT_1470155, partial [Lactarius hengduanensis]